MSGVMGDVVALTSFEVYGGKTYVGESGSAIVGTGVEFGNVNALDTGNHSPASGSEVAGSVDIDATDIVRTYTSSQEGTQFTTEDFNGTLFDFSGKRTPEIVGASVSTDIAGLDQSRIVYNSTSAGYNVSGLKLPNGQVGYIDLTLNLDDDVAVTTLSNGNHVIVGDGDGQKLLSSFNDKMTGGGQDDTFVFTQGCGHENVTDFLFSGAGHDVIDLSSCGFNSIAQVLQHTTMQNGSAVIHIDGQNTIKLENVTKSELIQNKSSIHI